MFTKKLLLSVLLVLGGNVIVLQGMDEAKFYLNNTFKFTGKKRYVVGWRVPDKAHLDPTIPAWQVQFCNAVSRKTTSRQEAEKIVKTIGNNINHPIIYAGQL